MWRKMPEPMRHIAGTDNTLFAKRAPSIISTDSPQPGCTDPWQTIQAGCQAFCAANVAFHPLSYAAKHADYHAVPVRDRL